MPPVIVPLGVITWISSVLCSTTSVSSMRGMCRSSTTTSATSPTDSGEGVKRRKSNITGSLLAGVISVSAAWLATTVRSTHPGAGVVLSTRAAVMMKLRHDWTLLDRAHDDVVTDLQPEQVRSLVEVGVVRLGQRDAGDRRRVVEGVVLGRRVACRDRRVVLPGTGEQRRGVAAATS